jgi:rare lipoprotein A (peptidoglycan hydrolase)
MRKGLPFAFVFVLFFYCSTFAQFPKYLYGIISWYGDDFAAKKTAGGAVYDPQKLTAAHKNLPFGTELEIENMENGKKTRVKINDRGPFVENRILDVSRKAAEDLGFLKKGTVYARVTLIKVGDNKPETSQGEAAPVSNSEAASSNPSLPAEAQTLPEGGPVAVVPAPAPSVAAGSSSQKTNDKQEVTVSNQVRVTNYVDVPVTNVIDVPPYEEKIVERDASDSNKINLDIKSDEEFILSEPVEKTPDASNLVPSAGNDEYKELEVTPEVLLSNENVVKEEEKNTKNEAVQEKGKGLGTGEYVIQTGAFHQEIHALGLYELLKSKGFPVFTSEAHVKGRKWIRVRTGYYSNLSEAKTALDKLKSLKIKGVVLKVNK